MVSLLKYLLGVDIGTSYTAAATWRPDALQQTTAEVVPLGTRGASVASVLFLGEDGSVLVGEAAERRALTDPDRVVREFKRRIGDETPVFVGGQPHAAHDLAATMVRWVVDRVAEREGGPPDRIAITHPAGWGPYKKDMFRIALRALNLPDPTLLSEPEAAAVSYAAQERVGAGSTIAVYDLGGGTFDAAVVHKTGAGSFPLLGSPDGIEQLGGADFDESIFLHVRAALGDQLDTLDLDDPGTLSGLARLRRECTEAKEALSSDTEVSIPVLLPGITTQVRLVRSEFEEMIRYAVEDTVDSLSRAVRSASLTAADLGTVLLVGGSSRIPLVSQLVSATLGRPVAVDADPKTTIALGAALSMADHAPPPGTTVIPPDATVIPPAVTGPEPEFPTQREAAPDRPPLIPPERQSTPGPSGTGPVPVPVPESAPPRRRLMPSLLFSMVTVALIASSLLMLSSWRAQGSLFPTLDTLDSLFRGSPPSGTETPGRAVPGPGDQPRTDTVGSLGPPGEPQDAPAPVPDTPDPDMPGAGSRSGHLTVPASTPAAARPVRPAQPVSSAPAAPAQLLPPPPVRPSPQPEPTTQPAPTSAPEPSRPPEQPGPTPLPEPSPTPAPSGAEPSQPPLPSAEPPQEGLPPAGSPSAGPPPTGSNG
jgi:actin-like ATPase involved in cell morphogenesis